MSNSPGDRVRRQDLPDESTSDLPEVIWEDEPMSSGLQRPKGHEIDRLLVSKWLIRSAFLYLMFTSTLCVAAILVNPSEQVRVVVLAVWGATAAVGGALLRRSSGRI